MLTKDEYSDYENKNAFMSYNHIEVCDVDTESALVKVTLSEESMNIMGYAHGGLIFTLVDCSAGLTARADGRRYVTQSVHINYLHSIQEGTIYGRASLVNRGHTMTIVHVDVVSEEELLLAEATVDMFCID